MWRHLLVNPIRAYDASMIQHQTRIGLPVATTLTSRTKTTTPNIASKKPTRPILATFNVFTRAMGTKAPSERALRRKKLREQKKIIGKNNVPELKATLRKLYLLTHPDLFAQYPTQSATNGASYKELLGFLDTVENDPRGFPTSASQLDLPFYLRIRSAESKEGDCQEFDQVVLHLHSSGSASKGRVEESLGHFFQQCGLPPVFEWPAQSWGRSANLAQAQERQAEDTEQTKRDREAESSSESSSSSSSSYETYTEPRTPKVKQDLHPKQSSVTAPAYIGVRESPTDQYSINMILDEMDPTLRAIAACPMLQVSSSSRTSDDDLDDDTDSEHRQVKDHFENQSGLDDFHSAGYHGFKPTVQRIWTGERRMDVLRQGLDNDTAQLIQRVLMHTLEFERQLKDLVEDDTTATTTG